MMSILICVVILLKGINIALVNIETVCNIFVISVQIRFFHIINRLNRKILTGIFRLSENAKIEKFIPPTMIAVIRIQLEGIIKVYFALLKTVNPPVINVIIKEIFTDFTVYRINITISKIVGIIINCVDQLA